IVRAPACGLDLLLFVLLALFFFHHPATTEIYTLSLHDALPIWSYTIDAETEPRRYTPSSFWVRRPWERVSTRTSQPSARSSRRRVRTEATTPLTTGSHQIGRASGRKE